MCRVHYERSRQEHVQCIMQQAWRRRQITVLRCSCCLPFKTDPSQVLQAHIVCLTDIQICKHRWKHTPNSNGYNMLNSACILSLVSGAEVWHPLLVCRRLSLGRRGARPSPRTMAEGLRLVPGYWRSHPSHQWGTAWPGSIWPAAFYELAGPEDHPVCGRFQPLAGTLTARSVHYLKSLPHWSAYLQDMHIRTISATTPYSTLHRRPRLAGSFCFEGCKCM